MYTALYCDRLYRHKKTKTFKDGFVALDGARLVLFDADRHPIDRLFRANAGVALSEDAEIDFERFYAQLGCVEASPPNSQDTRPPPPALLHVARERFQPAKFKPPHIKRALASVDPVSDPSNRNPLLQHSRHRQDAQDSHANKPKVSPVRLDGPAPKRALMSKSRSAAVPLSKWGAFKDSQYDSDSDDQDTVVDFGVDSKSKSHSNQQPKPTLTRNEPAEEYRAFHAPTPARAGTFRQLSIKQKSVADKPCQMAVSSGVKQDPELIDVYSQGNKYENEDDDFAVVSMNDGSLKEAVFDSQRVSTSTKPVAQIEDEATIVRSLDRERDISVSDRMHPFSRLAPLSRSTTSNLSTLSESEGFLLDCERQGEGALDSCSNYALAQSSPSRQSDLHCTTSVRLLEVMNDDCGYENVDLLPRKTISEVLASSLYPPSSPKNSIRPPNSNSPQLHSTTGNAEGERLLAPSPVSHPKEALSKGPPRFAAFKPPSITVVKNTSFKSPSITGLNHEVRLSSRTQQREAISKSIESKRRFDGSKAGIMQSSRMSQQKAATPRPAAQVVSHSETELHFRSASQCANLKKSVLRRTFQIPRRFSNPESYKTAFRIAILEHIQLQLDALALRIHPPSNPRWAPKIYTAGLTQAPPHQSFFQCDKPPPAGGGTLTLTFLDARPRHADSSKEDLWIVGTNPAFDACLLGVSVYYGVGAGGTVELRPFSAKDADVARTVGSDQMVWAVSAGNFMTEMLVYENLENLSDEDGAPVLALPALLGGADDLSGGSVYEGRCGEEEKDAFAKVMRLVEGVCEEFSLNPDQKRVVEESALALCLKGGKGFRLVHGVFGSGKTYLIAVTVIFLQRAVEEGLLGHIPDFRIAISSMSNVAVDQILQTLVSLGFENFVRVGSIKKIAKPLLPYTLQQIKNANEDLKELRSMLKGDSLDAAARRGVQEAMKRFTENKNRNLLDTSFVVASTCAACAFESLDLFRATILILDECSQMTEPLSLLPILRFNPQLSLLIGDPLQLAPTLETGSVDPRSSLDCTLYERMVALGRESIMLRVQYRCAKKIAQISNRLFYGGVLEHGCEEEKTGPAVERLPTTLFIDVSGRGGESRGGGGAGGGSLVNISEVEVVNRIVQGLIDSGQVEGTKIGVITYYKRQAGLIQQKLSASSEMSTVFVSTVDSFQGGERDVIIISTVRSQNASFIDEPKRVNVSLTRARRHLILIGDARLLRNNRLWREILADCDFMTEAVLADILPIKKMAVLPLPLAVDFSLTECHDETCIEVPTSLPKESVLVGNCLDSRDRFSEAGTLHNGSLESSHEDEDWSKFMDEVEDLEFET